MWSGRYDPTLLTEQEFELASELQHWGAATNLIDFSRDMDVATFFACDEKWECDGRIVVVQEHDWAQWRLEPTTPNHRAVAQKSVFLMPPNGIVTPWREIKVLRQDKPSLLDQLGRREPPITAPSIYNDLFGDIRLSDRYVQGMDYYHEEMELLDRHRDQLIRRAASPETIDRIKSLCRKACEKLFSFGCVWYEAGRVHYFCGELEEAKFMLIKAIRMGFSAPSVYGLLASVACYERDPESVFQNAKKGLELCDQQNVGENEEVRRNLEALVARIYHP